MRTLNASEFKAKCLSILEEIARTGEGLTILKRGKPIAQVLPAVPRDRGFAQDTLKGTVKILGDIVTPPVPSDDWEALDPDKKQ